MTVKQPYLAIRATRYLSLGIRRGFGACTQWYSNGLVYLSRTIYAKPLSLSCCFSCCRVRAESSQPVSRFNSGHAYSESCLTC